MLMLITPVALSFMLSGCEEDGAEKLTGSNPSGNIQDLSSRITGFNSSISGAGATLTANGTGLTDVKQVFIDGDFADNLEVTETTATFTVPTSTELGNQEVSFIFSGAGRATAQIEMVPLPVIDYFDLQNGDEGDVVSVFGTNMDFVTEASVGGTVATISDLTPTSLNLTVPSGASTGPIGLITPAGDASSEIDFVVCGNTPDNRYCLPELNGNGDFEAGTIGVLGEGGDIGGSSFTAGSPGAMWEIAPSPGGIAGLGDLSLKVTINELQNGGVDNWRIQWVNNGPAFGELDGYEVDPNRRFAILAKIWADAGGRMAYIAGGRRTPCCGDFAGGQTYTLNQGWNVINMEVQHSTGDHDAGNDVHATIQVNVNFNENLDGVLFIDDVRMVDIGTYQE